MDALQQLIYHEKQEKGSMMCAQHALNTLLQNNYFSASDLGELAQSLDELEAEYRSREGGRVGSSNMDDTGHFSVQVLDKALEVWGLSLVRWRSQELVQYHDDPDTQQSFILNLHHHWFTIRRFGGSDSIGHWFNLNSFFDKPQRVGVMYLGMVLNQAEAEGYSVFSVRSLNPGTEGPIIPLCEADEVASTLPDPQSHFSTSHAASTSGPTAQPQSLDTAGFEDEDIELQRALQASLQDIGSENLSTKEALVSTARPPSSSITRSHSEFAQSARRGFGELATSSRGGEGLRELHASASRSRALLERARLDQQMAFQEQGASRSPSSMRSRADQDEDELLRRAMEESLKESRPVQTEDDEQEYLNLAAEDNDSDYFDANDGTTPPQATPHRYPATRSSTRQYSAAAPDIRSPGALPPTFGQQFDAPTSETTDRVVDDEDAELQAALTASLEGLPEGFMIPEFPKRTLIHSSYPAPSLSGPVQISREEEEEEEEDSRMATEPPEEQQQLGVEEIRRRRLARFGG